MLKAPVDLATAREKIIATADSLDIAPEIVEDLFNRLSLVSAVKEYAATFDYAWFDYSYFSNANDDTVVYIDYSLQPSEVEYIGLFDATSACFFDVSILDYCFITEPETEYQQPFRPDDVLLQIRDCIHSAFVRTLPAIGLLVGNYTLPDERDEFTPSPRLEVYALPTSQVIQLNNLVDNMVRDVPEPVKNMYRVATRQLYGLLYSDNKRGTAMFKNMSEDEFRSWWIEYWSSQGLDADILNKIYNVARPAVDAMGGARVIEKLRFIRNKLSVVG